MDAALAEQQLVEDELAAFEAQAWRQKLAAARDDGRN